MRRKLPYIAFAALALLALVVAGAFFVAGSGPGGGSDQVSNDASGQPVALASPASGNGSTSGFWNGGSENNATDISTQSVPSGKTDPRIESSLNALFTTNQTNGPDAAAAFASANGIDLKGSDVSVVLEGDTADTAPAAAVVASAGGSVQTTYGDLLQAVVPLSRLADLAASGSIKYIRLPEHPTTFATTDEGVADIGANTWQSAGYNGTGVKIAIVDPGFASYQQAIASGDLPSNVITHSARADGDITGGGENHGTACAELVHDVAPGAQIYLVNFNTDVELGNAVDWLISQNITVVSASWGFFGSFRGDGQGVVDDAVKKAQTGGIFWANAAGNAAQSHWSGTFTDADNDSWNEFAAGNEHNNISATAGDTIDVYLTWNGWPATDQDYDLYLVWSGNSATPVATSDSWQSGTQTPTEELHYTVPNGRSGTYWVMIKNYSARGDAVFQLYTYPKSIQYQTPDGSLGGQPTDSAYAMTVGAVPVGSSTIESFSSRGPTIDGRTKPDIVGPDRVSTFTYGTTGFWGTSAAAPHAAGAGALLKQVYPAYGPNQVQSALESRATDLGAAGKDNIYGSGRLTLGVVPDITPPSVTGVQPSGNVYTSSATVAVYYYDNGSGINTSSVNVTLDGTALTGCAVTTTYASCPVDLSALPSGTHTIGGSVADMAGNSSPINGSFVLVCSAPGLKLGDAQPFWGSFADYLSRDLSVNYAICNTGSSDAYGLEIDGSLNTGSVITISPMPLLLGDIPAGACISTTVHYNVPPGVTVFKSITFVTVKDACGNAYAFPGVFPGI